MSERPIYVAIMAAAEAGRGVHLSAAEVFSLSRDDAIAQRAMASCEDDDEAVCDPNFTWTKILRLLTALEASPPQPELGQ